MQRAASFVDALRCGAFITEERLRLWPTVYLIGVFIAITYLFATAHGLSDYKGRPLGTDFSNVYAAGMLANEGKAAAPFHPTNQYAQEQTIFGVQTPFYGWHYPPFFLLIAAPLARLPYLYSLALWQCVTLVLYVGALALLLRKENALLSGRPLWLLLAVAFPAVFVNLIHGHNGFLTAALLGLGIALIDERPAVAGAVFGLLAYKPQFAFLIPVVLIATGRWRATLAGAVTVLCLACVVTLCFGDGVWAAFLSSMEFTRTVVLEQGNTGFQKIQSVFAWTRLWGGSVDAAYVAQAATTLVAGTLLVFVWRKPASFAYRGATLSLASLLSTPYCLDYDLMVLSPAIALMTAQGCRLGFARYEKVMLAALWIVPAVARGVADATLIPLAAPTMLCVLALIVWNTLKPSTFSTIENQSLHDARLSALESAPHAS